MPAPVFEVTQLNKLVRTLRRAGQDDLVQAMIDAATEAAQNVADAARPNIPRRSGKLADSLRTSKKSPKGVVRIGKASIPYTGPIHFGDPYRPHPGSWGGPIAPNPFLYDAVDQRFESVIQVYMDRIMKIAEMIANAD